MGALTPVTMIVTMLFGAIAILLLRRGQTNLAPEPASDTILTPRQIALSPGGQRGVVAPAAICAFAATLISYWSRTAGAGELYDTARAMLASAAGTYGFVIGVYLAASLVDRFGVRPGVASVATLSVLALAPLCLPPSDETLLILMFGLVVRTLCAALAVFALAWVAYSGSSRPRAFAILGLVLSLGPVAFMALSTTEDSVPRTAHGTIMTTLAVVSALLVATVALQSRGGRGREPLADLAWLIRDSVVLRLVAGATLASAAGQAGFTYILRDLDGQTYRDVLPYFSWAGPLGAILGVALSSNVERQGGSFRSFGLVAVAVAGPALALLLGWVTLDPLRLTFIACGPLFTALGFGSLAALLQARADPDARIPAIIALLLVSQLANFAGALSWNIPPTSIVPAAFAAAAFALLLVCSTWREWAGPG